LRSLTNGLPSRTNVCTRRKRTRGPQGGSPGLTPSGLSEAQSSQFALLGVPVLLEIYYRAARKITTFPEFVRF